MTEEIIQRAHLQPHVNKKKKSPPRYSEIYPAERGFGVLYCEEPRSSNAIEMETMDIFS